jgi:lipopolysaccharide export system permease protein
MNIISKILLKEWFKALLGSFFALFLLITTADLINGFLRGKNLDAVILEYLLKMPDLSSKILPVTCLLATLFAFNRLKQQSELIAIFAAGYSYGLVYRLLTIASLFVVITQFINLAYLEPHANFVKRKNITKSQTSEGKYLTRSSVNGGMFWYKTDYYFTTFLFFDRKDNRLVEPKIFVMNDEGLLHEIIRGAHARYIKPGVWLVENSTRQISIDAPGFPIETKELSYEFPLKEKPEDFLEFEADLTTLNFFQLQSFIKKIKKTGMNIREYQVLLMKKVSLAWVCIIFTLIPLSTIFNPNRRSASFGKNVGYALSFTVMFWVIFSYALSLGETDKWPPFIAAFIVPIACLAFVFWGFWRHRKLAF